MLSSSQGCDWVAEHCKVEGGRRSTFEGKVAP
jgi:hypothetical protein